MIGYTIISIDESRAETKANIRKHVDLPEATTIEFVDGRIEGEVEARMADAWYRPDKWPNVTSGELGVWLSNINCWEHHAGNADWDDALIVFEDDAIVLPGFMKNFNLCYDDLPDDWDALSLFVAPGERRGFTRFARTVYENGYPTIRRQGHGRDYNQFEIGSRWICKTYQSYSCVAMMYSSRGAERLLDLVDELGMYTAVDLFVFEQAHMNRLNVYSPKPETPKLVDYDWKNDVSLRTAGYRLND